MYSHLTRQSHYELTFRLSKKMNNVTCRIYFSQKFILDKYVVLLVLDPHEINKVYFIITIKCKLFLSLVEGVDRPKKRSSTSHVEEIWSCKRDET